jgi:hypothetical protein
MVCGRPLRDLPASAPLPWKNEQWHYRTKQTVHIQVLSLPAKVRAQSQVSPVGLLADRAFLEYLGFPMSVSHHQHLTLKCSQFATLTLKHLT